MEQSIKVINIKCGGCANTIKKSLEKHWVQWVRIDIGDGTIHYADGIEKKEIASLLSGLGYPEIGSREAESFLKKAQSYVSCAIGKIS